MMKKAVILLFICLSNGWLFANHWTPNDSDYEDNMTLTGIVQINGVEQQSTTLEVGAFCGEECRGSGYLTYFFPTQRYVIQLLIFGEVGDQMTFKLYDSALGEELDLASPESVAFNANGYGSLSEPYVLDFTGMGNTPHWVPNESEYEDNMTLTAVIQINGVEQQSTTLEVGVFCGDECRSTGMTTYFFPTQRYVVQLLIFGETGDQLTFKLYDHALGQELNLTSPDAVAFVANGYGTLGNPYVLNFTGNMPSAFHFITAGNWSNASNWSSGILPGVNDEVYIDANCTLNMNAEVAALTVTTGKTLTLQSGKTMTVTGTLTNTSVTGLVIEDGAQLVHASENVSATVKKSIAGYGTGEGNWCLIASPLAESVTPSIGNGLLSGNYDLYSCSPLVSDGLEWRNYKQQDNLMLHGSNGYLYANKSSTELSFGGILVPSNSNYVRNVSYYEGNSSLGNGWALLGNPFVCECYLVDADGNPLTIYKMNAEGTGLDAVESGPIAPFEGFFYYTPTTCNVYFSRTAPANGGVKD